MGLFGTLFGRNKPKPSTITSLVIGEDRTIDFRSEESTGIYLVDQRNLLAYDSYPEAIGSHIATNKGQPKDLGQICILYEPMSRPWSFLQNNWLPKETCRKKEIVLANARAEGYSMAIQRKDAEENTERMQLALLLVIGLFAIVIALFIFSSGTLSNFHFPWPGK